MTDKSQRMARFKQGESGNPNGRPKGSVSITTAIRDKLQEVNPKTQKQYLYELVDVMVEKATRDKDFRVIKEIWNHVDGSPRQTNEILGEQYLPIPILSVLGESEETRRRADELISQYLEAKNAQ